MYDLVYETGSINGVTYLIVLPPTTHKKIYESSPCESGTFLNVWNFFSYRANPNHYNDVLVLSSVHEKRDKN